MVQLRDDLLDLLDREAFDRGMSRSAVIREAVEQHLTTSRRAETGRLIVDGYHRIPQGTPDAWGSVADAADAATADTLQRLDDEDRRGGFAPW